MHSIIRSILIWTLVVFVTAAGASGQEGKRKEDNSGDAPKESTSEQIPANLLVTLVVGVDECYVFLRPSMDSPFFGPLVKEEKVQRLDGSGDWLRVWIPRLRISGWVRKYMVDVTQKERGDQGNVPIEHLSTLKIVKKKVNIRKAATVKAPIILQAERDQEFRLLDEKKGWYQIWIPRLKKKGWVAAHLVVKQSNK
ncbi:MAG: SH3 domain-containing protein [Deltaproteobacteria bacterium]|nr:MAG: SH3 domain-containing protein [Deltaproteobacteria bacterium]